MKKLSLIALTLAATVVNAKTPEGLICRDDRRMENGPLREIILTPHEGGFLLQSQYVPSLNSPNIVIENWAQELSCKIDEKATLAFCQNGSNQRVQIKERREVFYDSLSPDSKKKTTKYTDISLEDSNQPGKTISFASSQCDSFGGDA